MVNVYLHGPEWFFGVDAGLEAFATLIAFMVTFASFKIYRMTREKKYAYFTISFAILTLSFLSRTVTDAIIENIIDKLTGKAVFSVPAQYTPQVFFTGYVTHILLALTAYIILFAITHKITDKRIILLMFMTLVPSLLISGSYFLSFYGLSAIYLSFITYAYFQNYRKVCKASACLVFIAFLLIAVAQILFILEATGKPTYVAAHITQAVGYLVLLFALVKSMFRPLGNEVKK